MQRFQANHSSVISESRNQSLAQSHQVAKAIFLGVFAALRENFQAEEAAL
jgi:hypothetical protein